MRITDVRCVRREGTIEEYPDGVFSERLARPNDVYPEFREDGKWDHQETGDPQDVVQYFVEIETETGLVGIAGPVERLWAHAVLEMAEDIVGQNPLAVERVLDVLYGAWGDGNEGVRARAVSAIDVALHDLRGKHYGAPVHELLGGPTRTELPCYASMLGFEVDQETVREVAAEYRDRGYPAQKWFFRHGPGSGREGIEANLAMVEAAREAVGDDYDLMFDAWRSWGTDYASRMIDELAPYDPRWLEQAVDSQFRESYARLSRDASFPIAGGEHNTARWEFRDLLDAEALDVLQPDTYYTGGITEMTKICALASAYDVPVFPHGHSVPANVQLIAAQPPSVTPMVEFLIQRNARYQFFFEETVWPEDGTIEVPERPGIGTTIDDSVVEVEEEFTLD